MAGININFTPGAAAAREQQRQLSEQAIQANELNLAKAQDVEKARLFKRKYDAVGKALAYGRRGGVLAKFNFANDPNLATEGITGIRIEEGEGTTVPGSAGDLPTFAKGLADPTKPSSQIPKDRRYYLTKADGTDYSIGGGDGEPTAFTDRDIDSMRAATKRSVKFHKGAMVTFNPDTGELVSVVDVMTRAGIPHPENKKQRNALTTTMVTSMRNSWDNIKDQYQTQIDEIGEDTGALGRIDMLVERAIQQAQEAHEKGENMGEAVQDALDAATLKLQELIANNPQMEEEATSIWSDVGRSIWGWVSGMGEELGIGDEDDATAPARSTFQHRR